MLLRFTIKVDPLGITNARRNVGAVTMAFDPVVMVEVAVEANWVVPTPLITPPFQAKLLVINNLPLPFKVPVFIVNEAIEYASLAASPKVSVPPSMRTLAMLASAVALRLVHALHTTNAAVPAVAPVRRPIVPAKEVLPSKRTP